MASDYLMAGQQSELDRLQLQARVWEPAGRALLRDMSCPPRSRTLDIGCGVLGWLRVLSEWVGPEGAVVGSDIDVGMLERARAFVNAEGLPNVSLVEDDLFASGLGERSFDLVHSRFQIAPLGRAEEQIAAYLKLVKPGGWIAIEDPDIGSWRVNGGGSAANQLIALIGEAFAASGGNFSSGRDLPSLVATHGVEPDVRARVIALPAGHPYLRLPVQFATALKPRLERLIGAAALGELMQRTESELGQPAVWGTTFTLIQCFARVPR